MNGKIKNVFSDIHADEALKERTFDKITRKKAKKISMSYRFVSVMTVIALVLLGNIYFTPVSYISIDINPSIELSVNRFDRVIEVRASNEDAENIVNSVNLKNINYIDAIEKLNASDNFLQYNDDYAEITVISNSAQISDKIIENIQTCGFNRKNVTCHSGNNELKNEAENLGISFGKYRVYLELLEIDPTVSLEKIKHLPMSVIRTMIENNGIYDENINDKQDNQETNGSGNKTRCGDGRRNEHRKHNRNYIRYQ